MLANNIKSFVNSILVLVATLGSCDVLGQALFTDHQSPCVNQEVHYAYTASGQNCNNVPTWEIPGNAGTDYVLAPGSPTSGMARSIIWKTAMIGEMRVICNGVVASRDIKVNYVAPVTITSYDGSTQACPGDTTEFSFTPTELSSAASHEWSMPPAQGTLTLIDEDKISIIWSNSFRGSGTVNVTSLGCPNASHVSVATHIVRNLPIIPNGSNALQFCDYQVPVLSSNLTGYASFKWYDPQGIFIGQAVQQTYKIIKPGSYQFQMAAVDAFGCVSSAKGILNVAISENCDDSLLHRTENWIYNYDSAEQVPVIIGHTKSYFSSDGVLLQTQAKSFSSDSILTAQSVNDEMGREVLVSLPAPTGQTIFRYKHHLILNQDGERYSYKDFGEPLGDDKPGTVGWFYSNGYSTKAEHPKSGYPFTQVEYYTGDIGGVKRSGSVGEVLKIGSGHESFSASFPVFDELVEYNGLQQLGFPGMSQIGGSLIVSRDVNGKYGIVVSSDEGNSLMVGRSTGSIGGITIVNSIVSNASSLSQNYRTITPFYILHEQTVSITGTGPYTVENMLTGERRSSFANGSGIWPVGFYRLIFANANGEVTIQYSNSFSDVSFNFYDKAGQGICTISPNGFDAYKQGMPLETVDKTISKYDFRGQLIENTSVDAGTSRFLYRKDGSIRFSQNAKQAEQNNFSYTHYDRYGRAIESGQYIGTQKTFNNLTSELELVNSSYANADKGNWVQTGYDYPDTTFANAPIGELYKQRFTRGSVSYTVNGHSKTWYSYDEMGRAEWVASKPTMLNRVFVITYSYDFVGNVKTVSNCSYPWNSQTILDQFHHHYEYDADQRLKKAFTSLTEVGEKTLRATYYYYLHGPLKRIELGNNVQGVDFVYNIQGWLTQINHPVQAKDPGSDTNDAFGMVIDYYESEMANVFSTSASPSASPNQFHGLPDAMIAQTTQVPLIRFVPPEQNNGLEPVLPFKKFSAESPVNRQMISTVENK